MSRIDNILQRTAQRHPDGEAIVGPRRTVTWLGLEREVLMFARQLSGLGVGRGDRIAVLSKNRIEFAALYWAAARIGAVLVPLNWRLGPIEINGILDDAKANCVVAEPEFAVAELRETASTRTWLCLDDAPIDTTPIGQQRLGADRERNHEPAAEEIAVQMYTSGTTGRPKGAMLSHGNITSMTAAWLAEMPLTAGADRFLQVTPLFHVGGMLMLMSCATTGATMVLHSDFSPGDVARTLHTQAITHSLMVPAMIRWLLDDLSDELSFDQLRLIIYGASPIPVPLLARAMGRFGCDFLQGYGLTETAGVLTVLRPEDHRFDPNGPLPERLSSAGRAVDGVSIRVVDPTDMAVKPGEIGEIVATGPNVFAGYFGMPDATADATRGGWFHTGDLATVDAEGFVTIVDRLKDMILVGGENVYPREVEDVLRTHPVVADVAVVGIPHDVWGEEILAVVTTSAEPGDAKALRRALFKHARASLARFKCPTKVQVVSEIPRNSAGKVQKSALRAPYWQGRARHV